jgi:hypothetical protein
MEAAACGAAALCCRSEEATRGSHRSASSTWPLCRNYSRQPGSLRLLYNVFDDKQPQRMRPVDLTVYFKSQLLIWVSRKEKQTES